MTPEESFWRDTPNEVDLELEKKWSAALSKKGKAYLCTTTCLGYSLYGYYIPNAFYPGYGSFFIPIEPIEVATSNQYVLDNEELKALSRLNASTDNKSIFNLLGATDNKISGEFRILDYLDTVTQESGVEISNSINNINKIKVETGQPIIRERSIRGFVVDFREQTGLILEPITLDELKWH